MVRRESGRGREGEEMGGERGGRGASFEWRGVEIRERREGSKKGLPGERWEEGRGRCETRVGGEGGEGRREKERGLGARREWQVRGQMRDTEGTRGRGRGWVGGGGGRLGKRGGGFTCKKELAPCSVRNIIHSIIHST